jgi:hypothetical protein
MKPLTTAAALFSIRSQGKEMRVMPWYNNPLTTIKVLNKIANRYTTSSLQDLKSVLDNVTEQVRRKQDSYHGGGQQP